MSDDLKFKLVLKDTRNSSPIIENYLKELKECIDKHINAPLAKAQREKIVSEMLSDLLVHGEEYVKRKYPFT